MPGVYHVICRGNQRQMIFRSELIGIIIWNS
jgi:hypothetical protein